MIISIKINSNKLTFDKKGLLGAFKGILPHPNRKYSSLRLYLIVEVYSVLNEIIIDKNKTLQEKTKYNVVPNAKYE